MRASDLKDLYVLCVVVKDCVHKLILITNT